MITERLAEDLFHFMRERNLMLGFNHSERHVVEELYRFLSDFFSSDRILEQWLNIQNREGRSEAQRRAEYRMRDLESMLHEIANVQLPMINQTIAGLDRSCAYGERAELNFPNLVTIDQGSLNVSPSTPDPSKFVDRLIEICGAAEAIVIVDPYLLAKEDDNGKAISAVDSLLKIVNGTSAGDVFVYCRRDVTVLSEWRKLVAGLKKTKTLTVYFGDLHDRYIFAGSSSFMKKGSTYTCPGDPWNAKMYWQGAAFGGSINGIAKRPTYILKFEKTDVGDLIKYLASVSSKESLEAFSASKKLIVDNSAD